MCNGNEDVARLLYHMVTIQPSGNEDNEGLIGREREDHGLGFRATIFLSAVSKLTSASSSPPPGAQQRHHKPDLCSSAL